MLPQQSSDKTSEDQAVGDGYMSDASEAACCYPTRGKKVSSARALVFSKLYYFRTKLLILLLSLFF